MSDNKSKSKRLLARMTIRVLDHEPIMIGEGGSSDAITEINFYSRLNCFAFNADATVIDSENKILNEIAEPNAAKATITLYELPEDEPVKLTKETRIFQKTFSIESINVLEFDTNEPYRSKIKFNLVDIFDTLGLNKIITYSNFNIRWDSNEMDVETTIHRLLRNYEKSAGKTVIKEKIFGVNKKALKRRFITDCNMSASEAIAKYIDSLYNTRWYEFLSNSQPKLKIPTCVLAYSNQYTISDEKIFKQRPYITCANWLDDKVDKPEKMIYSIPYPKTGKILDYAVKDYLLVLEDCDIDLMGGLSGTEKNKFLAFAYRKHIFDPKRGYFEDNIEWLKNVKPLGGGTYSIETNQKPKYFGTGDDPQFKEKAVFNEGILLDYPFNIKENKYYYTSGSNSFYKDLTDIFFKPDIYVSIPCSAWHSPGQEIDLKVITKKSDADEDPEKEHFYSMNKLVSGRWKIINSVTNLKKEGSGEQMGFKTVETMGLKRSKYFSEK